MSLFNLIFLIIVAFILSFFLELIVRNRLRIEKPEGARKYVNKYHKFGEILFSSFFAIGIFFVHTASTQAIASLFAVFVVIYHSFAYYMQRKYFPESKEHILNLIVGMFLLLFIAVVVVLGMLL
ncbi:DUF4181 domain-containing protein [Radiobacillus sp. PE A8.2]|uniref:DUF4181 domain-containing protein n=1 Tax=Radiobacillus sp. PE A8.2 TaxID=3380349 RepID=UPI00388D376B